MRVLTIRSGGQTGVDRAALDAAIAAGLPYSGWCPLGGWAEDYPTPPGVLVKYPGLQETPTRAPEQRTAWNVRDSDATLILIDATATSSPGTELTRMFAELVFVRPFRQCDVSSPHALEAIDDWLAHLPAAATVLNIAGPRESESPGIYKAASALLGSLFRRIVTR